MPNCDDQYSPLPLVDTVKETIRVDDELSDWEVSILGYGIPTVRVLTDSSQLTSDFRHEPNRSEAIE